MGLSKHLRMMQQLGSVASIVSCVSLCSVMVHGTAAPVSSTFLHWTELMLCSTRNAVLPCPLHEHLLPLLGPSKTNCHEYSIRNVSGHPVNPP